MMPDFHLSCSRVFRQRFKDALMEGASKNGLRIKFEDSFGFLFGHTAVYLEGPDEAKEAFSRELEDFIERWNRK